MCLGAESAPPQRRYDQDTRQDSAGLNDHACKESFQSKVVVCAPACPRQSMLLTAAAVVSCCIASLLCDCRIARWGRGWGNDGLHSISATRWFYNAECTGCAVMDGNEWANLIVQLPLLLQFDEDIIENPDDREVRCPHAML